MYGEPYGTMACPVRCFMYVLRFVRRHWRNEKIILQYYIDGKELKWTQFYTSCVNNIVNCPVFKNGNQA